MYPQWLKVDTSSRLQPGFLAEFSRSGGNARRDCRAAQRGDQSKPEIARIVRSAGQAGDRATNRNSKGVCFLLSFRNAEMAPVVEGCRAQTGIAIGSAIPARLEWPRWQRLKIERVPSPHAR